jgi:hypothetical protein
MKKTTKELQDRINDTIAKNSHKGLWNSLNELKVSECKLGDIILTKAGSVFEINEIKQNVNRSEDLTIAVGKSDYIGSMYGSYKGTFPSIFKLNQI